MWFMGYSVVSEQQLCHLDKKSENTLLRLSTPERKELAVIHKLSRSNKAAGRIVFYI
jgi:hypothetical protein